MVIDANMYWFPEKIFNDDGLMQKFLSQIPESYGISGYETKSDTTANRQIIIEKPKGYANLNYIQNDYMLETQLADMGRAGVDKAVLKIPGCQEWMDLELCRLFNDGMADHVKRSGGRMVALATVPPLGTPECIYELERCVKELGMTGVQLSAHYGTLYLDDSAFQPFFEKANKLGLSVYVHHTPLPVQYDSIYEFNNLRRSYGRCIDQITAIGRELFSGFLAKYPRIKMVHSMLGGGFYTYLNMMLPNQAKEQEQVNRFDSGSSAAWKRFKNNLFFEMSHAQPWGKAQLECAACVLGADHILFGSSYPVRKEWLLDGPEFVRQLDLSQTEKEAMLHENAERIYHI